ncbi:hypothetical protein GCM10009863_20740 [Streptomyces axinellae]|uniref:Uncharacterized protein n=1 Tax=Streptomyces axinellae TaxID=552788 RepID=A0ABN3PZ00_9ACTN
MQHRAIALTAEWGTTLVVSQVREWARDQRAQETALRTLRSGEMYLFGVANRGVLYELTARPLQLVLPPAEGTAVHRPASAGGPS